jgi:hypothetical protein
MSIRFACAFVCFGLAISFVAAAPARHNFVQEDLTWQEPEPLPPNHYRLAVDLLDSESITRNGDAVEYDILDLQEVVTHTFSQENSPVTNVRLAGTITRFQASCGWRTLRRLPPSSVDPYDMKGPIFAMQTFVQERFLTAGASENRFLDKLCAGQPLAAARGAASVEDAVAFWKDHFGQRDYNAFLVNAPLPKQPPADWLDGRHPHRFVEIPIPDSLGKMLFLDRGNIERRGNTAESLTLVFLGASAQRRGFDRSPGVVMRKTSYDCAAGTAEVLAQASWNIFGEPILHDEDAFAPRQAVQSPVTAAELQAACAKEAGKTLAFADLDEAWTFAASYWPPPDQIAWAACLWQQHTPQEREAFLAAWRTHVPPDENAGRSVMPIPGMDPEVEAVSNRHMRDKKPDLVKPSIAMLDACAVPQPSRALAWATVQAYAIQRGTLEKLTKWKIDEAKLLTAWRAAPWLDRQHYIRSTTMLNRTSLRQHREVLQRIFDRLGTEAPEARAQIEYYLDSEARIETN